MTHTTTTIIQDHPTVQIIKALANVFFVTASAILIFVFTGIGAIMVGFYENKLNLTPIDLVALGIGAILATALSAIFGVLILRSLKGLDYNRLTKEMRN